MHARRFTACLLIAAVLGGSATSARPAFADLPRDDAAVDQASEARFQEGMKLFTKKKYKEARAAFLQAESLKHRSVATLFLAVCALRTGFAEEALEYLRQYGDEVKEPPPKLRAAAEATRTQARAMLAHVKVTAPDGAQIAVDDKPVGKAPLAEPLDLAPGHHTIKASTDDDSKEQNVTIAAGDTVDVKLALKARAPGPPPPAPIKTPKPLPPPPADEKPGLFSPPATMAPFYIAGAVGLVGMSSAIVFGSLKANADHGLDTTDQALAGQKLTRSACNGATPPAGLDDVCGSLQTDLARSAADARDFNISLVVGLVGVGAALGWYLFAPKEQATPPDSSSPPQKDSTLLLPNVGPHTAGASFTGRF